MDTLILRNDSEKFTFFVSEDGEFIVKVTTLKGKEITELLMSREELNKLILFIDENYDDIA